MDNIVGKKLKQDEKIYCPIDGLIVSKVSKHAKQKHKILESYIDITHKTRSKFIHNDIEPNAFKGGAVYIDLFCGPGRSKIKNSNEWIDGSPVVAWKESVKHKTPFTKVLIADINKENLEACKFRLEKLGAEVHAIDCSAIDALNFFKTEINEYGLNFCFIDPFNLKSLDFQLIESLAQHKRIDILIHLSKMDLQRNLASNIRNYESDFDSFIPGWREKFKPNGLHNMRQQIVDIWVNKVESIGAKISKNTDWQLITGEKSQPLYWLMLIAKHDLAIKFWASIQNQQQPELF